MKKSKFGILCLGLSLALLLLGPSSGYSAEWKGVRVSPYLGVTETYNDNITFQKDDKVSDFITSLNAGLSACYETHLSEFELAGVLHYNWFSSHDEFSNVSGDVAAGWKQELSKYDRLELRDNYVHSDEPITFADAFNTRAGRFTFQANTFRLKYEHDFSSQWSGVARYANQMTRFSTDNFKNTTMNSGGVGSVYHLDSKTDIALDYDYEVRDFEDGPGATDHIVSAGLRRHFTEWLYFDGRVGMDFIDSYGGQTYNKPRFEAKLTDEINRTTKLEASFEKKYSLNSYIEDLFNHWQVSASLKKEWTERIETSLAAFYGRGKYVESTMENDLIGANASFAYDLTKDWVLETRYSLTDIQSTDGTQEYRAHVLSLGVTRNF